MPLSSPRFASNSRLQKAADNAPPLRRGEIGDGVWSIQKAMIDLGYPMPISTKKFDEPDGIFGDETFKTIYQFQKDQGLATDGVVGRNTMARLDELFPTGAPPTPQPPRPYTDPAQELPYRIPGLFEIIRQPTDMTCWATASTMMLGWKRMICMAIETAMTEADKVRPPAVAARVSYRTLYDNNRGLPPEEFLDFLRCIGVTHSPLACYPQAIWLKMLKTHGPLWVGTLAGNTAGSGLHSRIIVAMSGNGSVEGTWMHIADPATGTEYPERFDLFTYKYEQAFVDADNSGYIQIRHF